MSGFFKGLFGGHSGSEKTDRTNQLAAFSDLNNIFNQGLATSTSEQKRGDTNIDAALSQLGLSSDYYKKLLSGDRTKITGAVQPTTNAIASQADAEKQQLESTATSRGGGNAGVAQQIEDKKRAATDATIAGVQPGAAAANADIASRVADIGKSQLAQALAALGISEGSASALGSLSGDARKTDLQNQKDIGGSIANLAITALGFL